MARIQDLNPISEIQASDIWIIDNGIETQIATIQQLATYIEGNIRIPTGIDDIIGLRLAIDGKADEGHTHNISDIVNLQIELDRKYDNSNARIVGQTIFLGNDSIIIPSSLGGVNDDRIPSTAVVGQFLRFAATNGQVEGISIEDTRRDLLVNNVDNVSDADKPVSNATQNALDGKVDNSRVLTDVPENALFTDTGTSLGVSFSPTEISIDSSTGSGVILTVATSSQAGLMSNVDKSKLDAIETSADVTDTDNVYAALGIDQVNGSTSSVLSQTGGFVPISNVLLPSAPDTAATTVQYELQVGSDGILQWTQAIGGGTVTVDTALSASSTNPVENRVINTALGLKQDTIATITETDTASLTNAQYTFSDNQWTIHTNNNIPVGSTWIVDGTTYTATTVGVPSGASGINLNGISGADDASALLVTGTFTTGTDGFFWFDQNINTSPETWAQITSIGGDDGSDIGNLLVTTAVSEMILAYLDNSNWAIYEISNVSDGSNTDGVDLTMNQVVSEGAPPTTAGSSITFYIDSNGVNVEDAIVPPGAMLSANPSTAPTTTTGTTTVNLPDSLEISASSTTINDGVIDLPNIPTTRPTSNTEVWSNSGTLTIGDSNTPTFDGTNDFTGVMLTATPTETSNIRHVVNLQYANANYARLSGANTWLAEQTMPSLTINAGMGRSLGTFTYDRLSGTDLTLRNNSGDPLVVGDTFTFRDVVHTIDGRDAANLYSFTPEADTPGNAGDSLEFFRPATGSLTVNTTSAFNRSIQFGQVAGASLGTFTVDSTPSTFGTFIGFTINSIEGIVEGSTVTRNGRVYTFLTTPTSTVVFPSRENPVLSDFQLNDEFEVFLPATEAGVILGDNDTANLLLNYEEGTWTPAPGVNAGSTTLSSIYGNYTRFGRVVTLEAGFRIDTTTETSAPNISGLPFSTNSQDSGLANYGSSVGACFSSFNQIGLGNIDGSILSWSDISGNFVNITMQYTIR